jgi:polar amino acid transport system substrate-binding protein
MWCCFRQSRRALPAIIILLLSMAMPDPATAERLRLLGEENAPLTFTEPSSGKVSGYFIDLYRELFRRAGIDYEIAMMPFARGYEIALAEKDTCMLAANLTEERRPHFKWVTPTLMNNWVLLSRRGAPTGIHSLDDLQRYRVGGYVGDAKTNYLVANRIVVDVVGNDDLNIEKLKAGRIDLWATTRVAGPWRAKAAGVPVEEAYVLGERAVGIMCNLATSDTVIDRLNQELQTLRREGFDQTVLARYQ